ncbi:ABC transporter [Fervidicella metallireducens AeB]|uniref:ABC transporter n=2 Tax=Fervidicella TaxID=1403538 RepID=A0A017S037_9CLOT|nr:ABC transporter [Fervidicella metallireducens AeB]
MSEDRRMNKPSGGRRGDPMGFGRPVEKPKDFKGTFKRLLRYLKPHRINLIIVLIFAIASTSFTIASPKIQSKALNKLQDAYMSRKMLHELAKGQNEGVNQLKSKMGDVQVEVTDKIVDNMAEAQDKAVEQITKNMSDAQVKAVDEMYKGIAIQLHQGVVSGQNAAVDNITKQMAAVQKNLVAQIQQQMQQMQQMPPGSGQMPPMDPKTMEAMQKLLKLPMIDSIKDKQTKIKTTIEFIDILQNMPAGGQMDAKTLASTKELLSLPLLETVKNPNEKINIIKKFLSLSKNMPGANQKQGMTLDEATMNKALSKIPEIKNFNTSNSSTSTNKMDKKTMDAAQKLLKLPMINEIKDPVQKKKTLIELIDIFSSMPDMSGASSQKAMSSEDMKTVKELIELPAISSIQDKTQKKQTVIKLVDIFAKMPDMESSTNNETSKTMDKEQLTYVKDLLQLPLINSITDSEEKTKVLNQMLDIFDKMPDMNTSDNKSTENKFDTESIKAVKEFISLPKLETLTNADEKADVAKKILDLSKKMQTNMENAPKDAKENIEFTDEQINSVITAIRETNGEYDFNYIGKIALILIAMFIISSLFSLIMGLVMSGVAQKTVRDLRREVDDKLSRLPLKYFDQHAHGDILSRITNDVDTIATTLQQSLTQIITSVITIIGYIIMMLTISPTLTLIVIATMPLYVIATAFIAKRSQKYFATQQRELGDLSGHVEEMYTGHKIVKAFGKENDSIQEFEAINNRLRDAGWKAQFISGIMFPLMNFISNLGYVGISIVGGIWITKSRLGIGDILAFIQYSRSFTMPIVQTANIANVIQSTIACAERVFQILDEEEEIPDSKDAVVIESPKGEVKFEDVSFRYKEDVPLIEDMNLDVEQGHTIAIVGPTGAGKTTLVNLLMRFYEINSGRISIDGVDIRDIKRSELRKMFGMVLQDTWLFNGTIKDNIAYGKEGATMEEIVKAAKAAHADHFIRTLPQGYDTVLNEEATNISQGQKQLLTIARAILADPKILILDEATSSVDTRTEVLIQKAMANLMKGRTSFVIAHRLSTIRDAEKILVMNKGSIIEMGNHKELLEKGGFYADLYNSQFANENIEEAV